MANISIEAAVCNNKGRVRGNNEDNFYLNGSYMPRNKMDEGALLSVRCMDDLQLYAVCDGMGGSDSGEEASLCAVHELSSYKSSYEQLLDPESLTIALRSISETVYREAQNRNQKSGTTIAMVLFDNDRVCVANVGDSRVYLFRNHSLKQVSLDHSKVQRLISMGLLTPEKAKTDPSRHVINQYLGMPLDIKVSPHIDQELVLSKGDCFLLCSDGLTDMVEDERIEEILDEMTDPVEAVKKLMDEAMRNGGKDNTTVMILRAAESGSGGRTITKKASSGTSVIDKVLTGAQILVGSALAMTILDFVWFLLHR